MSTTTTIRLPAELKARIASAAERAGKTTHSLILEAITEKAEQEELRAAMDAEADARFANIAASGQTIPWADMRRYLEERIAGQQVSPPAATKKPG